MCDRFVMYQSCQCIHLLCKFGRHFYFFCLALRRRKPDIARRDIYIYDTLYVHIYICYMLDLCSVFANKEINRYILI